MRLAAKTYRRLLRLAPHHLRQKHGEEMEAFFLDRLDEARGGAARARVWVSAITDLIAARVSRPIAGATAYQHSHPTGGAMFRTLSQAFIDAVRALIRRPAFSLLTILTLTVGLGFNIALFATVYGVMLRPLPFHQPDELVMVWTGRAESGRGFGNSLPDYLDWRARAQAFTDLAVYNVTWTTIAERTEPEQVEGAVVSANFFDVLRAPFQLGTGFREGDDARGADPVVVLTDSLWRRQYAADPGIVGRSIQLQQRSRRVVGVLAADYMHPEPHATEPVEYFRPFVLDPEQYGRGFRWVRVIGRLAPAMTLDGARAEMAAIAADLAASYPATNNGEIVVAPLHEELVGDVRPMLMAIVAIVSLVLILACVNVVNALLARLNERVLEFNVKAALGASRATIVTALMLESLVLALAGGAAGLLVAASGLRVLLAIGPDLPRVETVGITAEVVWFALGAALIAGAACGLGPAWRLARARLESGARGHRGSSGLEASRRRTALIAVEIALAVPLIVGAGLLAQTVINLRQVDKGFDERQVVQARITLEGAKYASGTDVITFFEGLLSRLRQVPGVVSAGMTSSFPLTLVNVTGGTVTGERADGSTAETFAGFRAVSAGYFETMGMTLLHGRTFDGASADASSAVISDRLAAALWPDQDPIGQRVRQGGRDAANPRWFTVIGIVRSVRQTGITAEAEPELFQPHSSNPWQTMTVVARTAGDPRAMLQPFKASVRAADPDLALTGLSTGTDLIDETLAQNRFGALAAMAFGAMGLLLAAVGTFAVLSLLVSQRTREIGIRIALGASPKRVQAVVIRDGMRPALIGCAAGTLLAIWLSRGLSSLLFGVQAGDASTLTFTIATMLVVALLASWIPARRAMRVDPISALRRD